MDTLKPPAPPAGPDEFTMKIQVGETMPTYRPGLFGWVALAMLAAATWGVLSNAFFPTPRPPLTTLPPAAYSIIVMGDRDGWTSTLRFEQESMGGCEKTRDLVMLPERFRELKESRGLTVSYECIGGRDGTVLSAATGMQRGG